MEKRLNTKSTYIEAVFSDRYHYWKNFKKLNALVDKVLKCETLEVFLSKMEFHNFRQEELESFFWSVMKDLKLDNFHNISKELTSTAIAKRLKMEDLKKYLLELSQKGSICSPLEGTLSEISEFCTAFTKGSSEKTKISWTDYKKLLKLAKELVKGQFLTDETIERYVKEATVYSRKEFLKRVLSQDKKFNLWDNFYYQIGMCLTKMKLDKEKENA